MANSRFKYSSELKYKVVKDLSEMNYSAKELSEMHGMSDRTIYTWKEKYDRYGMKGLEPATSWRGYSTKLKESAVMDYLSGEGTLSDIVRKYEITGISVLKRWIKTYNSHKNLKDTTQGSANSVTKRKRTTLEERIKIAQEALAHHRNYRKVASKYQVSDQQAYRWMRQYEKDGWKALRDRRGRRKDQSELTEAERHKLAMHKIEQENERLRAENAFLKKLKEIEGRRGSIK